MSAERHSLGESFQHGRRGLRSLIPASLALASKGSSDELARPFIPAGLIPAGPASALAIPPMRRREGVA